MKQKSKSWIGIAAAVALFLLGKLKWLVALLKLAKFASVLSIFVSLGAYALVYGWKFAIALVYLIFIHETGHLLAAKRKNIKTSKAIFLPFVGALIALKEEPKNAKDEAYLAYGGPLLGTVAFLPALPLFSVTNDPFWLLVITLGSFLNLFNLAPIHPMDGGRIVGVISTKIWLAGIIGMIIYMFLNPNPVLFIFLLFGISTWWKELRKKVRQNKRLIALEQYRFAIQQYDMYAASTEEERIRIHNLWQWELRQTSQKLANSQAWHFPFIGDKKRYEHELLETKREVLSRLLFAGIHIYDDYGIKERGDFEKKIHEEESQLEKEENYYKATNKTRIIWAILYIALALFLIACSMHYGELMTSYQDMLP
ncbi:site-2 protease family protein [Peribacillus sp. SCS-155]|uniref:site-2 protease family protein n=1 Tax=Peribacillus sedimenti TaxID=3115297 RepID=UPI0039064DCE